jgi:signal transduction histidine kinase/CHASE2 domain-containing sensor protein
VGGIAHRAGRIVNDWRYELAIFAMAAALAAAGLFTSLQQTIYDGLFRVVTRPPSGEIVLVQIDPRSLAAVATWPWPRSRHADTIKRLNAAGAELIALDIDFSSPSRPEEDAALAAALAEAQGQVVLPSFIQHAVRGVTQELTETEPLPALRKHALVGNANVFAPHGKARRGAVGLLLEDGKYRPTFSALLGQKHASSIFDFEIDFGIDTSKVHRISIIDVLNGSFDPNVVKGKRVVVGASAIELGDFVPVPVRGIIPGVELQLLMAESILQGRTLMPVGPIGALLIVGLTLIVLRPSRSSWSLHGHGVPLAGAIGALTAGPALVLFAAPVLVETAPALFAVGACFLCTGLRELSARARAVLRERSTGNFRRVLVNLIVEESSDGVVVADHAGRIELCNERAAILLNATPTTLMSRQVQRFLPAFDALPATGDSGETLRQTEFKAECDGGTVLLDVSVRRMTVPTGASGGEPIRVDVYTLRDVTARRRTEEAERHAQAERLMAERAKSNFIANMSHELRTPLNAIIGFSEMMASQLMGPLGQPQYVEFSQVVAKSGHHLLSLVNNILEISRIDNEAESLVVEEVDFDACAEASADFARSSRDYKAQAITVEVADGAQRVRADRRLIKQTLANLLSNAVKFTGPNGTIHVRAWVEGDAFLFEVSDNGIGIEPALMPHLTDLFRHADQSFSRKHEGMGAGLHLVKRFLDLMNGTLSFDSELGKGTRVRVTLPGAAVAMPAFAPSDAAA